MPSQDLQTRVKDYESVVTDLTKALEPLETILWKMLTLHATFMIEFDWIVASKVWVVNPQLFGK